MPNLSFFLNSDSNMLFYVIVAALLTINDEGDILLINDEGDELIL